MIDCVHSIELTIIRLSIFIISPFRECLPVSLSVFQEMPADLPTHFATLKYGMSGLKDPQALPVRRNRPAVSCWNFCPFHSCIRQIHWNTERIQAGCSKFSLLSLIKTPFLFLFYVYFITQFPKNLSMFCRENNFFLRWSPMLYILLWRTGIIDSSSCLIRAMFSYGIAGNRNWTNRHHLQVWE